MTQILSQIETRRCAVGKIDLKGRLVYVDDNLERMLGVQRENLFGKDMADFLCEESSEQLKNILCIRNHYETFYDALTLNIINNQHETFTVRIIASLNFAGGNPVNFLLIIDQGDQTDENSNHSIMPEKSITQFNELIEIDSIGGICDYLPRLFEMSGANHLVVYKLNDSDLEELKSVSDNSKNTTLADNPGAIQLDIAAMDGEYSFVNDNDVANAIESYKNSPNEYLKGFYIDGSNYLLRAIYSEYYNHQQALSSIAALKDACHLFDKILKLHQGGDNLLPDVKFTIGFLDTFRLPAFLTDRSGDVIGYNPTLMTLVKDKEVIDNYLTLLSSFKSKNNITLADKVAGYLNRTDRSSDDGQLHLIMSLPDRNTADLYVISLGDEAGDLSACFVLVPHRRLKIREE